MITVLVISIIVILIVLALSVLTIGKGYSYKHTVDPVKPLPEDEGKKKNRKMKKVPVTNGQELFINRKLYEDLLYLVQARNSLIS